MRRADLGDTVRIVSTPDTVAAGYADRTGSCYGFTTPSVTGVQVVADTGADDALNVGFDDGTDAWFDPSVVEFVDVNAGQTAQIGDTRFVREPSGEWTEALNAEEPWRRMKRGYSGKTIVIVGFALLLGAVLAAITLQIIGIAVAAILGAVGMMILVLGFGRVRAERED